jgi:F-box-like
VRRATGEDQAPFEDGVRATSCAHDDDLLCSADHILPRVTIESLPDNVLLEIFEFCRHHSWLDWARRWYRLTHVCQRWRYVVFASPLGLDLHLFCGASTPVRETLDVWPPLPIEIQSGSSDSELADSIIAALEHPDRIRMLSLSKRSIPLERLVTAMQKPFPALKFLLLESDVWTAPAPPDTFLGGFAPRLQSLTLKRIPLPTLPKFLLSCHGLSWLDISQMPHAGYISPQAMVTCISTLTRLMYLAIVFESPTPYLDRRIRHPPPLTRVVLPSLTHVRFKGVSEYLEDLMARIHTPFLDNVHVQFFNQLVFDIHQIPLLISHAPLISSYNQAEIVFTPDCVAIELFLSIPTSRSLSWGISCKGLDWQVSSMAQICGQFSFLLSGIEELRIQEGVALWEPTWQVDMDDAQWPELFHPFASVQTLRIYNRLRSPITSSLQAFGGELATELLPALDDLYLEGDQPSALEQQYIEPFITARQRSHHPVAVHR